MTEKEFMSQVWRPYDTITVDGGMKGRIVAVSFATKSVKVRLTKEVQEWFRYDAIVEHTSVTGETTDAGIIEMLHNKLMEAQDRVDKQQLYIENMKVKIEDNTLASLRKSINNLTGALVEKKKKTERVEKALDIIEETIRKFEADHAV